LIQPPGGFQSNTNRAERTIALEEDTAWLVDETRADLTAGEPHQVRRLRPPGVGLRELVVGLLLVGMVGTVAELVLLEHTESIWQWVPLVVFGVGVIAAVALLARPSRITVRFFQFMMLAFVAAGVAGLILHYRGNVEFELEMYPSMKGFELMWNSLKGATPSLAPGAMSQLGLIGLACTYRHPILRAVRPSQEDHKEAS
jgi:hypothetical protein